MKKALSIFAVAALTLPVAMAQSPWVTKPGTPVYLSPGSIVAHPYILAPQKNVLWGIGNDIGHGSSTQYLRSRIFRTTDDGQTWQQGTLYSAVMTSSPVSSQTGSTIEDLAALDDQTAWMLLRNIEDGTTQLLHTTAGPTQFVPLAATLPARLYAIHFFTATTGIGIAKVVNPTATTGSIYRTTDAGLTWTLVPNLPAVTNSASIAVSEKQSLGNILWLTSPNRLLRTTDAGLTWTTASIAGRVTFEDAQNGLSYYFAEAAANNRLARTTDGGATWTPISYNGPWRFKSMTAVAGMPGTYLNYSFRYSSYERAEGTTSISYDYGSSWQAVGTTLISGTFEQLISSAPGQVWAGLKAADASPNQPMVMRYGGTALPTKKSGKLPSLEAYPNPTTGQVQLAVELSKPTSVRVYDAAGRLCQQTIVTGLHPVINLQSHPAGLYQLVFSASNGQLQSMRVSKQ